MSKARKSATDIIASSSRSTKPSAAPDNYRNDPRKQLWCTTQWANLSMQAKKNCKLETLPYFDPETMLLSREVNEKLWGQLVSLSCFLREGENKGWWCGAASLGRIVHVESRLKRKRVYALTNFLVPRDDYGIISAPTALRSLCP